MSAEVPPSSDETLQVPSLPVVTGREATARFLDEARAAGRRVVFVNGCFDLLHPGHLSVFFAARARGDELVVALNSDASIRRLKGPHRPILPEAVRLTMVAALEPVSAAFAFDEDNAAEAIRFARPDIYAKGAEYRGRPYPESEAVAEHGVEVVYLEHVDGFSTTRLIERIHRRVAAASERGQ